MQLSIWDKEQEAQKIHFALQEEILVQRRMSNFYVHGLTLTWKSSGSGNFGGSWTPADNEISSRPQSLQLHMIGMHRGVGVMI